MAAGQSSNVNLSLDEIIAKRGFSNIPEYVDQDIGPAKKYKSAKDSAHMELSSTAKPNAKNEDEIDEGKLSSAELFIPVPGPPLDTTDINLTLAQLIEKRGIPKVPKGYSKKGLVTGRNLGTSKGSAGSGNANKLLFGYNLKSSRFSNRPLALALKRIPHVVKSVELPMGMESSTPKVTFKRTINFAPSVKANKADIVHVGFDDNARNKIKILDEVVDEVPEEEDEEIKDILFGPKEVKGPSLGSSLGALSALKISTNIASSSTAGRNNATKTKVLRNPFQ